MIVLVTGGTGNTGSRVARRLTELGHVARVASRHAPAAPGAGSRHVRFDWADPATHAAALAGVDALYLVPPVLVADPTPMMLPLIDRALAQGVRRAVLLSASVIPEGGPGVGAVHRALRERVPEWAVLQPSWFMQNFTGDHLFADGIRREGLVATATGAGRVGFVDADDIAEVAVRALLDAEPHNAAHVLTGPEALGYDDVAAIVTEVAVRPVRHLHVTREESRDRMVAAGIPAEFAEILAMLEGLIRDGAEDRVTDTVERVTGRAPRSLRAHVEAHAGAWETPAEGVAGGVAGA